MPWGGTDISGQLYPPPCGFQQYENKPLNHELLHEEFLLHHYMWKYIAWWGDL